MSPQEQGALDNALSEGRAQTIPLSGRNFLALGRVSPTDAAGNNLYVGYEIDAVNPHPQEFKPLDHRVRLLEFGSGTVRPLSATLEKPHHLVRKHPINLFDIVVTVVVASWRRSPAPTDDLLATLCHQAAETAVLSGLWSDAALMFELCDLGVRRLGAKQITRLTYDPVNADDVAALSLLVAEATKKRAAAERT